MRILSINEKDKEAISKGNLILLRKEIEEMEKVWHNKLVSTNQDHRYIQGVYTVLSDIKEVLT